MRGAFIVLIALVVAWYVDHTMYGGRYSTALSEMLSEIGHHAR
jgi:hypothetical protein